MENLTTHLQSYPKYRLLSWIAFFRTFSYTHARGFWWPWVPVLLACGLASKWFSLVMYVGELPLLIMLTRRAQHQTISDIGIAIIDRHHVSEGLKLAKVDLEITDDMTYGDFIVCNLMGEFARVNAHKEL